MAWLSPEQLNPLSNLPGAMMKGLEMRQMLNKAADDHAEFQQRTAQQAQQMQTQQDTANWQSFQHLQDMLALGGQVPTAAGTVPDLDTPNQPQPSPSPQAPPARSNLPLQQLSGSDGPNSMSLDALRTAVAPPAEDPSDQAPAAPQQPAANVPAPMRKAGAGGRQVYTVPFVGPDGQRKSVQVEMGTPQEQAQRAATMQDNAKMREALLLPQIDQRVVQNFGVALPDATADALGYQRGAKVMRGELPTLMGKAAEIGKSKADAALATAQTGGAQAESDIKTKQAEMMKNLAPEDVDAMVDGVIPKTGDTADLNGRTKGLIRNAVKTGTPLDKALGAIKDASDQIGKTETGVRTAKATAPIKVSVSTGEAAAKSDLSALTPAALANAAAAYRATGQMPSGLGLNNPTTRAQIMNAASAMGPIDLATNAAAYASNKGSLISLQRQADANQAFENAAGKNLDLFLQQAKGIVDSGSPLINSPLRSLSKSVIGSGGQAAYDTARQVATNEIAKVVTSLSGSGQLSDSARKEVDAFNPQNATLEQTYRVANVLRQDMRNRTQGYADQISDISKRIGGKPADAANGAHKVGDTVTVTGGKQVKITAVHPDGSFDADPVKQ